MKKSAKSEFTRRNFIKGASLSFSGIMFVPRHVLGGKGFVAPSDKVTVGIVGAGGKGKENTAALLKHKDVKVVAIADPAEFWDLQRFYYKTTAGRGPVKQMIEGERPHENVKEYLDFRKMLEKEKSIDAIMCSTPDHTHAYVSLLSMRAGKHVYCEKPLTHNIWEAREVQRVAKETGLATQMGNGGHSSDGIRETVEYLRDGIIGKVKDIHAWVPVSRWNPTLQGLPKGTSKLPNNFNWDLWLGPREVRDYHKAYTPVTWRDFWAFGCGAMGDFGCHDMDAAVWAYDLQAPESVELIPAGYNDSEIAPYGEIGYYNFKGKGNQSPINLTWYSGGLRPELHEALPQGYSWPNRGTMFVGDKGILVNEGGNRAPKLFPESLEKSYTPPNPSIVRSNGHYRDWIDAIKNGHSASSNFEYGARLTEITLLGVLSLRLGGEKVYWDAKNMKAIGLPEADKLIQEPIRKGWEM